MQVCGGLNWGSIRIRVTFRLPLGYPRFTFPIPKLGKEKVTEG